MNLWPRDLFVPAVAVIVLAVAVLLGALFYVTKSADTSARNHEQAVVANGVNVRIADIAEIAWSQIAQDDAAAHLGARPDAEWIQTNLFEPLYRVHGFETVYALNFRDDAIYAAEKGAPVDTSAIAAFAQRAAPLIASVREIESGRRQQTPQERAAAPPIQASAVTNVDGRAYVLTASVVRTRTPSRVNAPIIVTADQVDDDFLYLLMDRFLLEDLRLRVDGENADTSGRRASIALSDANGGAVATLEWLPETPGAALLRSTLPPVGFLIAALALLGLALYRRSRDATRALVAGKAHATHLAYHDGLTGLPNRLLLADRLGRAVEDLRRRETPFAVHCIDLDRFKHVNDTFGHQAGDEVIKMAAERISSACRQADTIARLGGDEFAVVQIGADLDGAARLAERLVALLSQPMDISVGRVHIGGSVGVSLLNEGAAEPQECLRQADLALYRVKESGRGRYCFFEPEMDATVRFRKALEADLREALVQNQFYLAYQPQTDGRGKLIGVEALLRWNHPERSALSPAVFIPVAEETGLIDAIGFFTLRRAFEDSRRWPGLRVAINISATQLRMRDFALKLRDLVTETGIDPAGFELEITEAVLLGDNPQTHETLRYIREMGFRLALDDFGTGYSSLSYLHRYPIDRIKIDHSFITNLGIDKEADAIVTAIIKLARALNLNVIAEGVETDDQRLRLALAGCSDVQGFLFGKAASVEVIDELVVSNAPRRPDTTSASTRGG
ncbi:MAG: EAL domain-containing protein [Terricaulis sp.]